MGACISGAVRVQETRLPRKGLIERVGVQLQGRGRSRGPPILKGVQHSGLCRKQT